MCACVSGNVSAKVSKRSLPLRFFSRLQFCTFGNSSTTETKGEELHARLSGRFGR